MFRTSEYIDISITASPVVTLVKKTESRLVAARIFEALIFSVIDSPFAVSRFMSESAVLVVYKIKYIVSLLPFLVSTIDMF